MAGKLKLRAVDAEDIKVVAAFLQDAILPIGDMCHLSEDKRFVAVFNRFKWETCDQRPPMLSGPSPDEEDASPCPYERTNCGVHFEGIGTVRSRGIDTHDRTLMLELLTIEVVDDGVELHFAGGGCIHLEGRRWFCIVEDIGEPWPTSRRPNHPDAEDEKAKAS